MRFHPEHLDWALDRESGSAYALPGPQGDLKHAIGQSIRKGNHVIIITAGHEAKDLMKKQGLKRMIYSAVLPSKSLVISL